MPEEILETPQPTEPKPTNWPKMILAAVLGFGLLAGAAYAGYWYGTQQVQKPTSTSVPIPTITPTPTPLTEEPTADWKTYVDGNYKISIKYPPTYKVTPSEFFEQSDQTSPAMILGDLRIDISEETKPEGVVLKEWLNEKQAVGTVHWEKEIVVGGVLSIYRELSSHPTGRNIKVYVPKGEVSIIQIMMFPVGKNDPDIPIDDESLNTFNQILSTFKFLN